MKTSNMMSSEGSHFLMLVLFATILSFFSSTSFAQAVSQETFTDSVRRLPNFSIHQDNYFITGVPTNDRINRNTANAKYQISFKQMVIKDALPWDTYLFATYTQKAFWDIYKESLPFADINFNPTIALGKPIYDKKNQIAGVVVLALDHESNGRDSIYSRSWNRISLEYNTQISRKILAKFKVWLPFGYKDGNSDLLEYVGLGEIDLSKEIRKDKLYLNLHIRKGLNFDAKGAIRTRVYYSPFKTNNSNQYFMLEWYLGQSEGLLDYTETSSMLRIGLVIKSNELGWMLR